MTPSITPANSISGLIARITLGLVTAFLPMTVSATVIKIEPNDYLLGTDLSTVSPYATLKSLGGSYDPASPIYAREPTFGFPAPTGEQIFGNFGAGFGLCEPNKVHLDCAAGFGVFLHQPVRSVSVLANISGFGSEGPDYSFCATWLGFNANGDLIDQGCDLGEQYGEPFNIKVSVPNDMTSIVFGGTDITNAVEYDRLLIRVQVPEPSMLLLLGLAIAGVILSRRRTFISRKK